MIVEVACAGYGLLFLRKGPQDMPPGNTITLGAGIVYVAVSFLLLRLQGAPAGVALLHALADAGILSLFIWLVLNHRGVRARVEQTLSSMLVTGVVFGLLSAPSIHTLAPYLKTVSHGGSMVAPSAGLVVSYVLLMAIVIWNLVVSTLILKQALETRTVIAFGWTIVYQLSSLLILSIFFGRAG